MNTRNYIKLYCEDCGREQVVDSADLVLEPAPESVKILENARINRAKIELTCNCGHKLHSLYEEWDYSGLTSQ